MHSPLKLSAKTESLPLIIVVVGFLLGGYFYQHFPAVVASHWNAAGQVNGYMGRGTAAFLLPAILLGVYLLITFLPFLDPKAKNYSGFAHAYLLLRIFLLLALLLIFAATGYYNLGYAVNIALIIPILLGLLMIALGWLMPQTEPNWFVGIRTPWTLSSTAVWHQTHKVGGRLFVILGLLIILCSFFGQIAAITAVIVGLVIAVLGTVVYSFVLYAREQH